MDTSNKCSNMWSFVFSRANKNWNRLNICFNLNGYLCLCVLISPNNSQEIITVSQHQCKNYKTSMLVNKPILDAETNDTSACSGWTFWVSLIKIGQHFHLSKNAANFVFSVSAVSLHRSSRVRLGCPHKHGNCVKPQGNDNHPCG